MANLAKVVESLKGERQELLSAIGALVALVRIRNPRRGRPPKEVSVALAAIKGRRKSR